MSAAVAMQRWLDELHLEAHDDTNCRRCVWTALLVMKQRHDEKEKTT